MRIHTVPLKNRVISEAAVLDGQGFLPRAPAELGNKTLTELLADGTVSVDVDPKYPQAIGISTITGRVSMWGNSTWDVLQNHDQSCPFFTSDYPIALDARDSHFANWIVPLAPDLAIRIVPDTKLMAMPPDLAFSKFTPRYGSPSRSEIVAINRLIVRCAEDMVFYRDDRPWVQDFIAKNRSYCVGIVTERRRTAAGFQNIPTQRIVGRRTDQVAVG